MSGHSMSLHPLSVVVVLTYYACFADGNVFAWERVRYLTRRLADHLTRRKTTAFEPGDIACCHGSIELSFYNHLKALQYPLERWEEDRQAEKPLRFCVINKRFDKGLYEVFLMTTFGQARTFDELGTIAHKYGVPVGGMNWFEDITPISTFPAYFGWEAKSFIFAIPAVVRFVIPTVFPRTPRLVPGELERLRKISDVKMGASFIRDLCNLESYFNPSRIPTGCTDSFANHSNKGIYIELVPPRYYSTTSKTISCHTTTRKAISNWKCRFRN